MRPSSTRTRTRRLHPAVRQAVLTGGCGDDLSAPYFNLNGGCADAAAGGARSRRAVRARTRARRPTATRPSRRLRRHDDVGGRRDQRHDRHLDEPDAIRRRQRRARTPSTSPTTKKAVKNGTCTGKSSSGPSFPNVAATHVADDSTGVLQYLWVTRTGQAGRRQLDEPELLGEPVRDGRARASAHRRQADRPADRAQVRRRHARSCRPRLRERRGGTASAGRWHGCRPVAGEHPRRGLHDPVIEPRRTA